MRKLNWTFACSLAALVGLALPAHAAPKGAHGHATAASHEKAAAGHEAAKGKAHEAEEAHAKGKDEKGEKAEGKDEKGEKGEKGEGKGEKGEKAEGKDEHGDQKGAPEAVQKKLVEMRATRKERRAAAVAKIKQHWGDKALAEPAVQAELKVHAWRMARLDRIRELASAENKTDIVARVDKLIAQETARHDKHMDVLEKGGAK